MLKLIIGIAILFQVVNAQAIVSERRDRGYTPYTQRPKEKQKPIVLTKAQKDSISLPEKNQANLNTIFLKLDTSLSVNEKALALKKANHEVNTLSFQQSTFLVLGGILGTGLGLGITGMYIGNCVTVALSSYHLNTEDPDCVDNINTVATLSFFTGTSLGILISGYKGLNVKTISATLGATLVSSMIASKGLEHGAILFLLPPLSGVLAYALSYDPGIKVLEAQVKTINNEVKMNYELIGYSFNF